MKARQVRATYLFAKGASQAEISEELTVSQLTVSDWQETWLVGGNRARKAPGCTFPQGGCDQPGQSGAGVARGDPVPVN